MSKKPAIWFTKPDPAALNERGKKTANERVGIEITEAGPDYLKGRMMVDERTSNLQECSTVVFR